MVKKEKNKKKKKASLVKKLSLILGVSALVIVIAIVVISAINKSAIKYISVDDGYHELFVGNPEFSSAEVNVGVFPETANASNLVVYSSDNNIATARIENGKISIDAVASGNAIITVQHASKSSIKDTIEVVVNDIEIQDLDFISVDQEGNSEIIDQVDIKKDGFEHKVKFDLNPIDANMNNIKLSYDTRVLSNAYIDQESKTLVVVPYTDIVQTSTTVDVELFQMTSAGYVPVQYVRLQLNLKAREAYIRFNLSNEAKEIKGLNHNNIVYLENENATDVFVVPEIGYDVDFASVGAFNINDYNIYFDGEELEWNNGEFSYQNKLKVTKTQGNFFYFSTLPSFAQGDNIYVTFEHIYTGVINSLQFIYLDVESIGLNNNQSFGLNSSLELEIGEVSALSFLYDNGVKYGVVEIYTYKMETINGKETRVETTVFGDAFNNETIEVQKLADKIFLKAKALTKGTLISFGVRCTYWDSRYVRISEDTNISRTFVVENPVNEIYVEIDGVETNLINIVKNRTIETKLVALPYGNQKVDYTKVDVKVTKNETISTDLVVELVDGVYEVRVLGVASGTYLLEYSYNGMKASLYVIVS